MTNVIILAAGMGTRLSPLTDKIPKCMIEISGETLIKRVIRQVHSAFTDVKITVVGGHQFEKLSQHLNGVDVSLLKNDVFESTNNMYSLNIAINNLNPASEDVVILNSDCIYDDYIISSLQTRTSSTIMVDESGFTVESMKICQLKGRVTGISKAYSKDESSAVSIDLYRFFSKEWITLVSIIDKYISNGEVNAWTEVAINDLVRIENVTFCDIEKKKWYEIDDHIDLENAEKLFV